LTGAVLDGCDLTGAVFGGTGLEKADLRTAWGYVIDPSTNRIRGARFAYPAVLGLLDAYGIDVE
ncbi:MAG: pentapeptide repeat-containing protein, partial [Rikenellaceae bacterium]|nr:pentapeptide repeat-containing protein [Rikenellaceae bacterium]